jgi:hypothetical protein
LAWLFYILNNVCFSFHVNASRAFFFLQSCVNVVFKHDCGLSSLSLRNLASFSYVFMLDRLLYKLCNEPSFSCAIRVIDLGIDMVF